MDYLKIDNYFSFKCRDIESYVFKVKVKEILPLYYVAVRGKDEEEGAVQRILNTRRISEIANYVLKGNMFLNTFILNWANKDIPIEFSNSIIIPKIPNSLQVLDGQHRLEGIKKAYESNPECGENEIIVVLTNRLSTTLAAEVFLNINSEQKQVPKSLVYDLFGEIRDPEYNINRARELSERMDNDPESPFYQIAKMPGTTKGKIDFSTMVSALKDYLKENGVFDQYGLTDFEVQYKILYNYHCVLREAYGDKWISSENPFLTSAGYYSLTKFFVEKLVPICVQLSSFEKETIKRSLDFSKVDLLYRADIKNIQGKEQRQRIFDYLFDVLKKGILESNDIRF